MHQHFYMSFPAYFLRAFVGLFVKMSRGSNLEQRGDGMSIAYRTQISNRHSVSSLWAPVTSKEAEDF